MNEEVLGIDLGGTSFNIGRVKNGQILQEACYAVDASSTETELLNGLYELIDSIITTKTKAIGIGVPGIVDSKTGILYDIQNIPVWKEVPLRNLLEARYKLPIHLNNDANCFVLGEKNFGKGKGFQNFIGLSIGTGLGMGVIIKNELYNGVICGAGEIGMLPYKDGIVEDYVGSFYFTNTYQQSGKEVHELAKRNQPQAVAAFKEFGNHLAEAIKMILFMYAPEAIILGGSLAKAYPYFKETMEASIAKFPYPKQLEHLTIIVSEQSNVPILGAAALCY